MDTERGFTLIELLVVVAIIGILAAIAIPQFSEYKKRGFNSRALADLKNVITAEEAYYAANEGYVNCGYLQPLSCEGTLPGIESISDGVLILIGSPPSAAGEQSIVGGACHDKGDSLYVFESAEIGLTSNPGIIERQLGQEGDCAAAIASSAG